MSIRSDAKANRIRRSLEGWEEDSSHARKMHESTARLRRMHLLAQQGLEALTLKGKHEALARIFEHLKQLGEDS